MNEIYKWIQQDQESSNVLFNSLTTILYVSFLLLASSNWVHGIELCVYIYIYTVFIYVYIYTVFIYIYILYFYIYILYLYIYILYLYIYIYTVFIYNYIYTVFIYACVQHCGVEEA